MSDWERWNEGLDEMTARDGTRSATRMEFYDALAERAASFFRLDGDLLDVGCGTGYMCRFFPRARYHGVDPRPPRAPEFDFKVGVGERLPYESARFDSVLAFSVLQHVLDPAACLNEMVRVVKPGGALALLAIVDCADAVFMHRWTLSQLVAVVDPIITVRQMETIRGMCVEDGRYVLIRGMK